MSPVICIDFDQTINSSHYPDLGEPTEGVKEAFEKLRSVGYEIHILSCRTNPEVTKHIIDRQEQCRTIKRYLEEHDIPYDVVLNEFKPIATYYIDDRAVEFKGNWDDVLGKIKCLIPKLER